LDLKFSSAGYLTLVLAICVLMIEHSLFAEGCALVSAQILTFSLIFWVRIILGRRRRFDDHRSVQIYLSSNLCGRKNYYASLSGVFELYGTNNRCCSLFSIPE
jgi:hypothetical protein